MKIAIQTRTPLWTGSLDRTMTRIHEAGILGSLRWWYEAIVRGLGGYACDPGEHTCSFDAEKYHRSQATEERQRLRDAGLCDACQVFGATGWKRRFRLEVTEDRTAPVWQPRNKTINIRPPGRKRGWYLLPGRAGRLTLKIEGEEKAVAMLAALLLWLEKYGAIGARPQLGYGAFSLPEREAIREAAQKWEWQVLENSPPDKDRKDQPDLRHFLFFHYAFAPSLPGWWTQVPGMGRAGAQIQPLVSQWQTAPTTPALKNEWRFNQWPQNSTQAEIFGTLHPERRRGRISATWAYSDNKQWTIHGWAWMPQKNHLAQQLYGILSDANTWHTVLGVQGSLTTTPMNQWKVRSATETKDLLQNI